MERTAKAEKKDASCLIHLPRDTWRKAKAFASLEGRKVADVAREWMVEIIEQKTKKYNF